MAPSYKQRKNMLQTLSHLCTIKLHIFYNSQHTTNRLEHDTISESVSKLSIRDKSFSVRPHLQPAGKETPKSFDIKLYSTIFYKLWTIRKTQYFLFYLFFKAFFRRNKIASKKIPMSNPKSIYFFLGVIHTMVVLYSGT